MVFSSPGPGRCLTCHPGVTFSVGAVKRTVKQVAVEVGLPERTVRYYDRIGLVAPYARSSAGYRLYGPEEEGKLRFVRQAKSLGLSLDDARTLIAAAERGYCGEVAPELDRLLDQKVAQIDAQLAELAAFRERLTAFRAGRGASCGCRSGGAFCGCLNSASAPAMAPAVSEGRTTLMSDNTATGTTQSCGCAGGVDGCGCGCGGSCGCGSCASGTASTGVQIAELEQAKRQIDRQLSELQRR